MTNYVHSHIVALLLLNVLAALLATTTDAAVNVENVRVVKKEELANKTNDELWLAILGEVYNVTAGSQHYKVRNDQ